MASTAGSSISNVWRVGLSVSLLRWDIFSERAIITIPSADVVVAPLWKSVAVLARVEVDQ